MAGLWQNAKPRHALPRPHKFVVSWAIVVCVIALLFSGIFASPVTAHGQEKSIVLGSQSVTNMSVSSCAASYGSWQCKQVDSWKPLTDGKIKPGSTLRFKLDFYLPRGTISESNHIVTYQMPDSVKNAQETKSTPMTDPDGRVMAHFTVNSSGLITINYTDLAIKINSTSTSPLNNWLFYYMDANKLGTDDKGNAVIPFGNNKHLSLTKQSDISITKNASYNSTDRKGAIRYTLNVSSGFGTNGPVTIKDQLDQSDTTVKLDASSFSISPDIPGWDKTKNVVMNPDGKGFTLTGIPALKENETYHISYQATADVKNKVGKTILIDNKASASSQDQNKQPISSTTSARVTFTPQKPQKPKVTLSKWGYLGYRN